ncbi:M20 family metallopeptidase [Schlesneria sp. T3-172]|uniref:M20 family metallopeptidase n=1 Tax=Schlesneria TaxID=656899 RepID=UPI002EF9973F
MSAPLTILKDLVSIPSVNPMGRDVSGPEYFETRVTEYLLQYLKRLDVPFEQVEIAPGRSNVLARLDAPGATKTVLLDAHQDTVPVDGMTIPPFEPVEQNGRLYGRGSCDVKGGMAAMLAAFTRLAKERPAGMSNVVLSLTCDEEATSIGINHLTDSWSEPVPPYRLCPTRPDVAIVAEPTQLDIVVAHRGATRWKLHTAGRACHSSRPEEGINAIYRMAKVVLALEEFAAKLPTQRPAHPLCGPATLSVGRIDGGSSVNIVPDHCHIEVDRRLIPGEDRFGVIDELADYLRSKLDFEVTHEAPYCASPSLGDDLNGALSEQLMRVITSVVGPRKALGVPYGTHASRFAREGIAAVVFGPGDIAQAHTKDEWIEIAQLDHAAEIYYRFCAGG